MIGLSLIPASPPAEPIAAPYSTIDIISISVIINIRRHCIDSNADRPYRCFIFHHHQRPLINERDDQCEISESDRFVLRPALNVMVIQPAA